MQLIQNSVKSFGVFICTHPKLPHIAKVGVAYLWREKVDPRIIAAEEPMLRTAFKIGLIGCVFSFVMIIVSNAIYYW